MDTSNSEEQYRSPFYPLVPSIPISFPIETLEDLELRSYFNTFHYPFNKSAVPLVSSVASPDRERILVCHDMAGGYLYDKWVQGGNNEKAYAIWHWHLIDVFVYFSHNLVTLPPPCWTNSAHKHDVKVLGTFIVESDEGKKICDKLLSSNNSAQMYADRLTELASSLGFDGWLLNFEVNLDARQVPVLKEFINCLTRTSHDKIPGSLVIWYDAVTIDGELSWQNQLNEKNKPFFDMCDGIYVNYQWEEEYPNKSAANSEGRKFDVYMGIDVFGRGTFGGGQANTKAALNVLKNDHVSAAIFAPGWVYETNQPPNFQVAQNRWWSTVEDSWRVRQKNSNFLPLYFNFDQFSQPILHLPSKSFPNTITVKTSFEEPFSRGGGNVILTGTLEYNASFRARIFQGAIPCGILPIHFTYSVKTSGTSKLGLLLGLTSEPPKANRSLLLAPTRTDQYNDLVISSSNPDPSKPEWTILESRIPFEGYTLTSIHALGYDDSQSPTTKPLQYDAMLGDLVVRELGKKTIFPPSQLWVVEKRYVKWGAGKVSAEIVWKQEDGMPGFEQYNVYVERKDGFGFVGVARVEAYYVSDFDVRSEGGVKFVVQMCGKDGLVQKLEDCPSVQLQQA